MVRFFLGLASILLVCNVAFASDSICSEKSCIGVVDVGSTGSRLHVYAYSKSDDTKQVEEVWSKRVNHGFATLPISGDTINNYLKLLFKNAPKQFPVYFYATAGMRLLPTEDQQLYYDAARKWFETTDWTLQEARTITGREEGAFAWLSVHEALRKTSTVNMPRYLSVMDMGGASVQVVSAVDVKRPENIDDYIDVKMNGKTQTLFVHSFLGLGQVLVSEQFLNEPSCFSEGYSLPNGGRGEGNARLCSEHVSKLINGVHEVHHVLYPVLHTDPLREWYVIEGLTYLAKEAPFEFNFGEMNNDALLEQAEHAVCHRPWKAVQRDYPEDKKLSRACLTASYYHALIKAYGIAPREPIHFVPETGNADWTLGVALHQR
ncbi:MAG: multidrug DMT transporter permease [Legionellaceae bacterium]|nr:multidrug DMT transporter permease [Legionellaceae bacterium]